MALGPLMIDLAGTALTGEERDLLRHPLVGGVILFSRNYQSPRQIRALNREIHALRQPPLLIAVDHEGGRVQRFREVFFHLPASAELGRCYDRDPRTALALAEQAGWLMASELRAVEVDFSFAPVLDLGHGLSRVIGDRALHRDPDSVANLGQALMRGMRKAGMAAVGKHFPGHGSVIPDSHHEAPVDERCPADILGDDMRPFERLIHAGLPAIMPAHVVYAQVDSRPAGFSEYWLKRVLRGQLGFQGAILSDDLSMAGAALGGTPLERARLALRAGCDMLLICNQRAAVLEVLDGLDDTPSPASQARLSRLHGLHRAPEWDRLHADSAWQQARDRLAALEQAPELDLREDRLA
jgi:beta-N-acetylhexosaminidase